MTPAPAWLFDLDGTLADTLGDIAASTNAVRAHYGLEPVGPDLARTYVGDGARMLLRRALATVLPDPTETDLDAAFAVYAEHHREQCTRTAALFPGVGDFLGRLRSAGSAIAVVTNKSERFALPVCRHLGLDAFTDVIIGGDTLPLRKPDPAPLRLALRRLGTKTAGAVMVGDGLQDVAAGKALGLCTVACLFGFHEPAKLRAAAADVYWQAFGVEA